jgi:hypothetical protein
MGNIRVVGVYPVEVTKAGLLEDARIDFGEGNFYLDDLLGLDDNEFSEHFKEIFLIEVIGDEPGADFDVGAFTQAAPGQSPDAWQVAYDEKFLDSEGSSVCSAPMSSGAVRLAFFFHHLDQRRPLLGPDCALRLPEPTPMPQRLRNLFRYLLPC